MNMSGFRGSSYRGVKRAKANNGPFLQLRKVTKNRQAGGSSLEIALLLP